MAATTRACPSCQTPLPEVAAFCYVCGTATHTGPVVLPHLLPTPAAEQVARLQQALGKHYELGPLIGRGVSADVFQVRDLWLRRDLALKALRTDPDMLETTLAGFRREAESVAALRHPNILPIYDIGVAHGVAYILMPFIKGESLAVLLGRDGRRPVSEARRILLEAAGALAAAHEAGVVHCDVKPENIMLDGKARRVLLMDFALARMLAGGDPHLDHRSDQYSLAAVGYHMLTGTMPFAGRRTGAMSEVPEALMEAIARGMAKEPADRFPDIESFAAAVEAADPPRVAAAAAAAPAPAPVHRWWTGPLAGAAGLAALAIAVALVRDPPAAEPVPPRAPDSGCTSVARGSDQPEAIALCTGEAERGSAEAQYLLGIAYLRGRGVTPSDSIGVAWLAKAAAQGHVEARKEVARRR